MERIRGVIRELRRRRVFGAAGWFGGVALGVLGVLDIIRDLIPVVDRVFPALVLGAVFLFPVVLVLSWAFDITPSGIRWAAPPDGETFRLSTRVGAVVLVVGASVVFGSITYNLWDRSEEVRAEAIEAAPGGLAALLDPTHIAVLYFDDHSPGGELGPLANGLTEDLINALVNVQGLTVTSRNGVKPYQQNPVPVDSIARALRVGTIVEGSVTGSGDRIRATAQLIDAADDVHLWSQQFDVDRSDFLSLQDTLVRSISLALREELGIELELRRVQGAATNPEAWTLYQRAMNLYDESGDLTTADPGSVARRLEEADSLLVQAQILDPEWADPAIQRVWVALVVSRQFGEVQGYMRASDSTRVLGLVEEAVERVGETPEVLEARGVVRYEVTEAAQVSERGYDLAAEDLLRAVREKPSLARAWAVLSDVHRVRGGFAEATHAAEMALEADAFLLEAPDVTMRLFEVNMESRELEQAERWCVEGRRRFPDNLNFALCRFMVLTSWPGRADTAYARALVDSMRAEAPRETWDDGYRPWALLQTAKVVALSGAPDSARALIPEARGPEPQAWLSYDEAHLRLILGERDEALNLLELYLEDQAPARKAYLRRDWWFEALWDDPRFLELTEAPGQ
jgi:TolB-like protein